MVQVHLTQAGRDYIMERYQRLLRWTTLLMEELGEQDSKGSAAPGPPAAGSHRTDPSKSKQL